MKKAERQRPRRCGNWIVLGLILRPNLPADKAVKIRVIEVGVVVVQAYCAVIPLPRKAKVRRPRACVPERIWP